MWSKIWGRAGRRIFVVPSTVWHCLDYVCLNPAGLVLLGVANGGVSNPRTASGSGFGGPGGGTVDDGSGVLLQKLETTLFENKLKFCKQIRQFFPYTNPHLVYPLL